MVAAIERGLSSSIFLFIHFFFVNARTYFEAIAVAAATTAKYSIQHVEPDFFHFLRKCAFHTSCLLSSSIPSSVVNKTASEDYLCAATMMTI